MPDPRLTEGGLLDMATDPLEDAIRSFFDMADVEVARPAVNVIRANLIEGHMFDITITLAGEVERHPITAQLQKALGRRKAGAAKPPSDDTLTELTDRLEKMRFYDDEPMGAALGLIRALILLLVRGGRDPKI